jgi:hypothetical protein
MSGRGPDYRVAVSGKREGYDKSVSTYVGSAWRNKAGGVNIRLNPGVQLVLSADTELVLWPSDDQRGGGGGQRQQSQRDNFPPDDGGGFGDDNLPFSPYEGV